MLIFFFDMQNISATFVTGLGLKIDAAIPGGVSFLRYVSLLGYWAICLLVSGIGLVLSSIHTDHFSLISGLHNFHRCSQFPV